MHGANNFKKSFCRVKPINKKFGENSGMAVI
jgi:hypothetical protein